MQMIENRNTTRCDETLGFKNFTGIRLTLAKYIYALFAASIRPSSLAYYILVCTVERADNL